VLPYTMAASPLPATRGRMHRAPRAVLFYHESNQRFYLHAYRSTPEQWLLLSSDSKNTTEVRIAPADEPAADWQLLSRRHSGHEYHVDHGPQGLLIRSNDRGENFALYRADPLRPLRPYWELLVDVDPGRTLEDFS